jgi:outer membrane protein assembly factor BamB
LATFPSLFLGSYPMQFGSIRQAILFAGFCFLASPLIVAARGQSPGWPQFLGPQRNGISGETGLLRQWPAGGPKVLWRVAGGVGMSAVAVQGSDAITMWNSKDGQVVAAIDTANGNVRWKTAIAANYENGQGDGPRGTPVIVGDRVLAYSGQGVLACLARETGKVIWREDVVQSAGVRPAEYGMACSPLVVDDLVIVTAGGQGSAVVALAIADGQRRWSAASGTPGYSSPALLEIAGQPLVVAFTGAGVSGIRPSDGQLLWTYPFKTPYDCNTATPIQVGQNIFISAGENHGCVMLSVVKNGDRYAVKEVWQSVDVKSVLRNEWQTSVLLDGYLYGFDNVGSAGPTTHLTCVDAKTGQTIWRENRFGKGNLVAADGHLWITTMKGELVLVKASPDGFRELGRQRLFGKTRQSLSIADRQAYLRDDREVVCLDIGG